MGNLARRVVNATSPGEKETTKVKTCVIYKNKAGKQCYKGTKQLRKTEFLVSFGLFYKQYFPH